SRWSRVDATDAKAGRNDRDSGACLKKLANFQRGTTMKKMQGFTLIELMIVVAIIAILSAIALPAYQDYVIRSQVSEGSVLSDGAKTAVAEFYSNVGHAPLTNTSAGLALNTSITCKFVDELDVVSGVITTTFASTTPQRANASIHNSTLSF